MNFTNKELKIIRAALTDSLDIIAADKEDLDENASESILNALRINEEETLSLIDRISNKLEAI